MILFRSFVDLLADHLGCRFPFLIRLIAQCCLARDHHVVIALLSQLLLLLVLLVAVAMRPQHFHSATICTAVNGDKGGLGRDFLDMVISWR